MKKASIIFLADSNSSHCFQPWQGNSHGSPKSTIYRPSSLKRNRILRKCKFRSIHDGDFETIHQWAMKLETNVVSGFSNTCLSRFGAHLLLEKTFAALQALTVQKSTHLPDYLFLPSWCRTWPRLVGDTTQTKHRRNTLWSCQANKRERRQCKSNNTPHKI